MQSSGLRVSQCPYLRSCEFCSGEVQSSAAGLMNFGGVFVEAILCQALGGCVASDQCCGTNPPLDLGYQVPSGGQLSGNGGFCQRQDGILCPSCRTLLQ